MGGRWGVVYEGGYETQQGECRRVSEDGSCDKVGLRGNVCSPLRMDVPDQIAHDAQRTAQLRTAQHSTAQHSTAQHSTAQHSTAQHSTA